MDKKVLIVHPYDKSTRFLERIKNYLQAEFPEDSHYFNVKPNLKSHNQCLELIMDFSNNHLLLFMGHGKSNSLYGAKGDYYGTLENNDVKSEKPDLYYYNDDYINLENIDVLKDKKVIVLSCNSNSQIGRKAVAKGAKVFLGFGDLPTSIAELEEKGEENKSGVSLSKIEQALKTEINDIVKKSIAISIKKNNTFTQLFDLICFVTNQKISHYLVNDFTPCLTPPASPPSFPPRIWARPLPGSPPLIWARWMCRQTCK
jgi:hypothetical protein